MDFAQRVPLPAMHMSVDRRDDMRLMSFVGAAGLTVAVLMAIFGLPPVDLHGPLHRMGIMDPLCGGTRAARLTAQGDLTTAWRYNPLGIIAAVAAALAVVRLAFGLVSKRWINLQVTWTRPSARLAIIVAVALAVALQVRQQGRADLLLLPY